MNVKSGDTLKEERSDRTERGVGTKKASCVRAPKSKKKREEEGDVRDSRRFASQKTPP